MKVAFVSEYLFHHLLPLSLEMANRPGVEFKFVAWKGITDEFQKKTYDSFDYKYPFVIRMYESDELRREGERCIMDADILVCGGLIPLVYDRIKAKKITFIRTERYRKPMGDNDLEFRKLTVRNHINRFIGACLHHHRTANKCVYYLAASAFLKQDLNDPIKNGRPVYKWGYFPAFPDMALEEVERKEVGSPLRLIYCGRMIRWKCPDYPLRALSSLINGGIDARLTMIGDGYMKETLQDLARSLDVEEKVSFLGPVPAKDIQEKMKEHDIFLFPSNASEGWGVVLNEAMGVGLAPIVCEKIGAAPFLIKDGVNGLLFKEENVDDMIEKTVYLATHRERIKEISIEAYKRIHLEYNAEVAAERLLKLYECIKEGKPTPYIDGICSLCE